MKSANKLLCIIAAIIFTALFLLYGYDFYSNLVYYARLRYRLKDLFTWIDLILTATTGICFLISAIGCITKKTRIQKTAFGLLAFITLCFIMNRSYLGAINRILSSENDSLLVLYCMPLAILAYALLLLMAIRIPTKSRILGILASGTYVIAFIYYFICKRSTPSMLGIMNLLLFGSGAVLFGLLTYAHSKTSENPVNEKITQNEHLDLP